MNTDESRSIEEGDISMFIGPDGSNESDGEFQEWRWRLLADHLPEPVKNHRLGQDRKCGIVFFQLSFSNLLSVAKAFLLPPEEDSDGEASDEEDSEESEDEEEEVHDTEIGKEPEC